MRNVILAVVVVVALTAVGVGGTFAHFSDIETSQDNFFEVGSMDLKVSNAAGVQYDDKPYGVGLPAFFQVSDAWPCCSKDIRLDLHNAGQGFQSIPKVYIHFKNVECYHVEPTKPGAYEDPITTLLKPEPELVAEHGGIAGEDVDGNKVRVDGVGPDYGEDCNLQDHIDVAIFTGPSVAGPWDPVDLSAYDVDPADGIIKLDELECNQIYLVDLACCETIWLMITLHLQDVPEEYFGLDYFDETIPEEAKWNDWPTNALMKDGLEFDMAFHLLQV